MWVGKKGENRIANYIVHDRGHIPRLLAGTTWETRGIFLAKCTWRIMEHLSDHRWQDALSAARAAHARIWMSHMINLFPGLNLKNNSTKVQQNLCFILPPAFICILSSLFSNLWSSAHSVAAPHNSSSIDTSPQVQFPLDDHVCNLINCLQRPATSYTHRLAIWRLDYILQRFRIPHRAEYLLFLAEDFSAKIYFGWAPEQSPLTARIFPYLRCALTCCLSWCLELNLCPSLGLPPPQPTIILLQKLQGWSVSLRQLRKIMMSSLERNLSSARRLSFSLLTSIKIYFIR